MPFPMVHLCIADKILSNQTTIEDNADYTLGSIAPDAVHFRDSYLSDYKKVSHFCSSNKKWGEVTENDAWLNNVLNVLQENNNSKNKAFYLGYCIHIIADILWNIKIWIPYRKKHKQELEKFHQVGGSTMHKECNDIDFLLYKEQENNNTLWENIENTNSINIPNIVEVDEIDRLRDNIINRQYIDRQAIDCDNNKIITMNETKDFIQNESEYIRNLIFG
ncbi:MAG: zinc dependent phospholipase C family protein [Clostridiales bacterium]|nr:zinc dependent phospholipase C family protein [Clostridiales bacterium]